MPSMFVRLSFVLTVLGCDQPAPADSRPEAGAAAPASAIPHAAADAGAVANDAGAVANDAGTKDASAQLPERPVPKNVPVVSMNMPVETQMKAITYMAAMRAPHSDDPNSDPVYAEELRKKLQQLSFAMDRGANKSTMNRSEVLGNGRQIDLWMADGCEPETPKRLLVQRAGVPFTTAYAHGVLVIRCNDKKLQCLQSVRDPDDVLCTSAPRRGKPGGGLPGKP